MLDFYIELNDLFKNATPFLRTRNNRLQSALKKEKNVPHFLLPRLKYL